MQVRETHDSYEHELVFQFPLNLRKVFLQSRPFLIPTKPCAAKPRTFVRGVFIQMLSDNEWAFDLLYCVAFLVMDKQWLEKNATYMEFNDVLRSTQIQLEKELLMDDVLRIEDLPSYTLLC
nr:ELMO domain-containing protein A isoform X2 [Ipomoea batatas]